MNAGAAHPLVLLKALLTGAAAIGIPSLLLLLSGQLSLEPASGGSWLYALSIGLVFFLSAALVEELVTRGIIFSALESFFGWKWALIITSVGFGLMHLNNPGADALSIMIVILAGFFLGMIMLATRSLYASWMAHFSWNFVMAALLHVPVSGWTLSRPPDYKMVDSGPDWLTGGTWGPEGGMAAASAMLFCTFYLYARFLKGPLGKSIKVFTKGKQIV